MTNFADRLSTALQQKKTPVLVGLDPRWEQLPTCLKTGRNAKDRNDQAQAYVEFCNGVIEAVAPLVAVVKPQAAFFEELGPAGMNALAAVMQTAREHGLLVVLDGKRNDIGSTAYAYAHGYLGNETNSGWGVDALTVSPYLGDDSLTPFVDVAKERGCGIFVLVKTSNPGGKMFQDLTCDGQPLYRQVANYVEHLATETVGECGYGAIGAVVGATYPAQLAELRAAMPHTFFLVPGYGAQGGGAADVAAAFDERGLGAIVNNSRGIIFAHASKRFEHFGDANWQRAVEAATHEMIDQIRCGTNAGKLSA